MSGFPESRDSVTSRTDGPDPSERYEQLHDPSPFAHPLIRTPRMNGAPGKTIQVPTGGKMQVKVQVQ